MISKENITGQTVYEQLQEILYKRKPQEDWDIDIIDGKLFILGEDNIYKELSFHWLFSKDSGIMEWVEWEWNDLARDLDSMLDRSDGYEYWSSKCHNVRELHEMIMAKMKSEEKVNYFVKSAIVPTK